ncbi:MAG: hypothetical protein IT370_27390 [Deltaproteobacteria bacterium]|nr:hypothetical protein [Deltaproteobacteria bacterium]
MSTAAILLLLPATENSSAADEGDALGATANSPGDEDIRSIPFASMFHVAAKGAISASGGWDGARRQFLAEAGVRGAVFRRVNIHAAAVRTADGGARPMVGVIGQIIQEARGGVSLFGLLQYKPEGFTEPEGEVEAALAGLRHFGRTALVASVTYGQDPEGNERDFELGLAARVEVSERVAVGLASRGRMGHEKDSATVSDLGGGAFASFTSGQATITVTLGASAIQSAGQTHGGPWLLTEIGYSF